MSKLNRTTSTEALSHAGFNADSAKRWALSSSTESETKISDH
jgi:hypothetical protein